MKPVKVTEDFMVPLPEDVRQELNIKAGSEFQVLALDGRIQLIPAVDVRSLRGFAKGIDVSKIREKKD